MGKECAPETDTEVAGMWFEPVTDSGAGNPGSAGMKSRDGGE